MIATHACAPLNSPTWLLESLSTYLIISVFHCLSLPFYDSGGKAVLESSLQLDSGPGHSRLPRGGGGVCGRPAERHRTAAPSSLPPSSLPQFPAPSSLSAVPCPKFPVPSLLPPVPCPQFPAPVPSPQFPVPSSLSQVPCPQFAAPVPSPPFPCPSSLPPVPCPSSLPPVPCPSLLPPVISADQYNVGVAPLFQALDDLQSSIADTVVFPEPGLLPLHAMCVYC